LTDSALYCIIRTTIYIHILMLKIISIIQIVIALLVVVAILMQNKGSGAGAVFGGGGGVTHTRRGAEKWLHYSTVALVVSFVILGVISLIIQG